MGALNLFTFLLENGVKRADVLRNNTSHASGPSQDGDCATGGLLVFRPRDRESRNTQPNSSFEGMLR